MKSKHHYLEPVMKGLSQELINDCMGKVSKAAPVIWAATSKNLYNSTYTTDPKLRDHIIRGKYNYSIEYSNNIIASHGNSFTIEQKVVITSMFREHFKKSARSEMDEDKRKKLEADEAISNLGKYGNINPTMEDYYKYQKKKLEKKLGREPSSEEIYASLHQAGMRTRTSVNKEYHFVEASIPILSTNKNCGEEIKPIVIEVIEKKEQDELKTPVENKRTILSDYNVDDENKVTKVGEDAPTIKPG
ncbi:hypothetical protein [Legionella cincinnatiensis]|uniref:Uncharacterized protein n=1 Tax=Legionella cincinnatiensis TaxID=28085 RepID=A0A378IFI9_9GAMM|nr:hypothetical protein [Legionella cincinnatiensis]KTC92173.1 hypothetical protein Lcin_0952 [Legionella cincinnatiensis]STX33522.1 Uncharacterised protein [Legionella cincinnatiensis]